MFQKLPEPESKVSSQVLCRFCVIGIFDRIRRDWIIKFCQILIIQHLGNNLRIFLGNLISIISHIARCLLKWNGERFLGSVVGNTAGRKQSLLIKQHQQYRKQHGQQYSAAFPAVLFPPCVHHIESHSNTGHQYQVNSLISKSRCSDAGQYISCHLHTVHSISLVHLPHQFIKEQHQEDHAGRIRDILLHHGGFHREKFYNTNNGKGCPAKLIRSLPSSHQRKSVSKCR